MCFCLSITRILNSDCFPQKCILLNSINNQYHVSDLIKSLLFTDSRLLAWICWPLSHILRSPPYFGVFFSIKEIIHKPWYILHKIMYETAPTQGNSALKPSQTHWGCWGVPAFTFHLSIFFAYCFTVLQFSFPAPGSMVSGTRRCLRLCGFLFGAPAWIWEAGRCLTSLFDSKIFMPGQV